MAVPAIHAMHELPIYYGVGVEHRVEVPRMVEVPVPVEVPIYHEMPRERAIARVAGGWAVCKEDGQHDVELLYGRASGPASRSRRRLHVAEIGRIRLPTTPQPKYSRPPPSPLARAFTKPHSPPLQGYMVDRSHREVPREALKAAASRAVHGVSKAEAALAVANRTAERARMQMERFNMREQARAPGASLSAVEELRRRQAIDDERGRCERELHETAALVCQRERLLEVAWRTHEGMVEAVELADEDHTDRMTMRSVDAIAQRPAHAWTEPADNSIGTESLESMQERHAAELAALLEAESAPDVAPSSLRVAWRRHIAVAARAP